MAIGLHKNNKGYLCTTKSRIAKLEPSDKFMFSPANKLIFVASPIATQNSVIVTAYTLRGSKKGSYEYKNTHFSKFTLFNGFVNMVYAYEEPNGVICHYQGKLLDNGYITDIIALHRATKDGKILEFIDKVVPTDENAMPAPIEEETAVQTEEINNNEEIDTDNDKFVASLPVQELPPMATETPKAETSAPVEPVKTTPVAPAQPVSPEEAEVEPVPVAPATTTSVVNENVFVEEQAEESIETEEIFAMEEKEVFTSNPVAEQKPAVENKPAETERELFTANTVTEPIKTPAPTPVSPAPQQAQKPKICPLCGANNPHTETICNMCGNDLD